jgi:membrane fusion protein
MQDRVLAQSAISGRPNGTNLGELHRDPQPRVTPLFRQEVLQRRDESDIGETIDIVPVSHLAFASFSLLIILIAATYAALAGYSRKETVQGVIVPSRGVIRVMAPRPGTITEMRVNEGDVVTEDQVLFQVVAEATNVSGTGSDTAVLDALREQRTILEEQVHNEAAHNEAETRRLNALIVGLRDQADALASQRQLQADRVAATRAMLTRVAPYAKSGTVSKFELFNRQQAVLSEAQSLGALDERLASVMSQHDQAQLNLRQQPILAADRLDTLKRSLSDVAQRAAEIEGRRRYIVRAPIAGRVTSVQARLGRAADPRIPQLSIVPTDGRMEAELFVPARAIGFVQRGEAVRLLYDAFPFQRFGAYSGSIISVAETMVLPTDIAEPVSLKEPAYKVRVALERQSVDANGRLVPLQPDMTLVADIILERRPLVEWLFEPLLSARRRG